MHLNKALCCEIEKRDSELASLNRQYQVGVFRLEGFTNKYKQEISRNEGLIDLDGLNEESPNEWKLGNPSEPSEKLIPDMVNSLFEDTRIKQYCDWVLSQSQNSDQVVRIGSLLNCLLNSVYKDPA